MYPTLCLHPVFPRYQQRPAGSDAAAACPVPRQGPQQPLHGAVGPGNDPALPARGGEGAGWGFCPGCGRAAVSQGCHPPAGQVWGSQVFTPPLSHVLSLPHQGLTHLGKGTLTLCPYHSDRQLMSQVAVAGLLTVLVSFLDVRNSESCGLSAPPGTPLPRGVDTTQPPYLCLPSSYPGQVTLRSLWTRCCHAAPHAGHL